MNIVKMKYSRLLSLLALAVAGLIPFDTLAQTRPTDGQILDYKISFNNHDFVDKENDIAKGLLDDDPNTIWDSKTEQAIEFNDNDRFGLLFDSYDLRAGDILQFDITFANQDGDKKGTVTEFWAAIRNSDLSDWNFSKEISRVHANMDPGNQWTFTLKVPEEYNNTNVNKNTGNNQFIFHQDGGDGYKNGKVKDGNACNAMRLSKLQVKFITPKKPTNGEELNYYFNPNERGYGFGTIVNKLKDNNQNSIWDSKNEAAIQKDDNDKIWLKFDNYDLKGGDLLRFDVTFADQLPNNGSNSENNGMVKKFWIATKTKDSWNSQSYICTPSTGRTAGADWSFVIQLPKDFNTRDYELVLHQDGGDGYKNSYNKNAMRLSEFKVTFFSSDDIKTNEYTIGTESGKNLFTDLYDNRYANYRYVHTHGWVETNYGRINVADGTYLDTDGQIWDSDGKYIKTPKLPDNFDMDFTFLGSKVNEKKDNQVYDPVAGASIHNNEDGTSGTRQRTYTIVHELTAFPGERVDLYPYSDIHMSKEYGDKENKDQYQEDFVRWYDYQTDKRCDNLFFFQDPRFVMSTPFGHIGGSCFYGSQRRSPITVASFMCPKEGLSEDGIYIAADFSMQFTTNYKDRINDTDKTIYEPVIMYRHVFHITKAKTSADNFNGNSGQNNVEYTKKHRRILSARENETFTIRLDYPMPDEGNEHCKTDIVFTGEGGKFSYDNDNGKKYGRVRKFEILAYDYTNNQKGTENLNAGANPKFIPYQRSSYTTMNNMVEKDRITELKEKEDVYWKFSKQKYYRAIRCEASEAKGKYLVQIVAKDNEGKYITADGKLSPTLPVSPLIVQEYVVEFLPDTKASFLTEKEYNRRDENGSFVYETHHEEYLEAIAGDNKKVVDFDEYNDLYQNGYVERFVKLEKITKKEQTGTKDKIDDEGKPVIDKDGNVEQVPVYTERDQIGRIVKLPIQFNRCNYGSSYNIAGDYNMYKIIDHSGQTPFQRAAMLVNPPENVPYKDFLYGNTGGGVYDRLFYNTEGRQRGFMYYVNAASDPGEIVSIPIERLCNGTTIYVSAWVNEFTEGQPETANVIFNFRAKVNEYDKDGNFIRTLDKVTLHGFTSGYVKRTSDNNTDEGKSDTFITNNTFIDDESDIYKGDNRGEQGQWMHVYYSFVPDISQLSNYSVSDGNTTKFEYELVLENNCVSSKGADYAVDDVRMYLVPPRVEARQVKPICDLSNATDVSIKINMPFESLLQANGLTEAEYKQDSKSEAKYMQYAILNKKKYEDYLNEHKDEDEVYQNAFHEAVLKYPHRHIVGSDNAKTANLPWGSLKFHLAYEDNPKFDYGIIDNPDDPGVDHAIGAAKREEIDNERNIVFISTPKIEDILNNPEYIIVVGNFESTGIFSDDKNKNNSDVYAEATSDTQTQYDKILAKWFDMQNCARKVPFKVSGPAQIIVDGYYQPDGDNITCCENQRPVVQVNLYGSSDKTGGLGIQDNELSKTPYVDWYHGSLKDFNNEKIDENGKTLREVLTDFRKSYHTANTWDMPVVGDYTKEEREYLKGLCESTKDDKGNYIQPKLVLYQSSFVFPKTPKGETDVYVTAIPLDLNGEDYNKDYYICTSPTQVKIHVANTAPSMFNGFASGINYQKEKEDVALRIGLDQLNGVSGDVDFKDYPKGTNYWENTNDVYTLYMPLRDVTPATNGVTELIRRKNDPYVYLAETNDPAYRQLGAQDVLLADNEGGIGSSLELPGLIDATAYDTNLSTGGRNSGNHIGNTQNGDIFVYNVNVTKKGKYKVTMNVANGNSQHTNDSKVSLGIRGGGSTININIPPVANNWTASNRIFDNYIEFDREGTYDLLLTVQVAPADIYNINFEWQGYDGYDPDFGMNVVGELVNVKAPKGAGETPMAKIKFYKNKITFKEGYYYKFKFAFEEDYSSVAKPEEEPCNGETVFSVKVVPEYQKWTGAEGVNWNNDANWSRVTYDELNANSETDTDLADHVTNDEANKTSYAPLDFTKVIIPAGTVYPQLAERAHDREATDGSVSVNNGKNITSYVWASTAPAAITLTSQNVEQEATADIQYDMASVMYTKDDANDKNVYCRPWYANAAEQVHFNSNAEIYAQQYLDYDKAWVDMEMTPARWYIASSPLQDVVAGDMYLPTEGARQETRLFTPITFNKGTNDRFRPAVYQRGWDKGTAMVYELPNITPETRGVAVALDWSEVYNDVKESYFGGLGYSIKTDVSEAKDFTGGYVKFRLPKADAGYEYWDYEGKLHGPENGDGIERANAYRLNDVEKTVTLSNVSGQYYLAGNPFMAHIDMKTFLTANKENIEPKFWVLEGGTYQAYTLSEGNTISSKGSFTDGVLPPMQGFFLAKKGVTGDLPVTRATENEKLEIKFTPAMMAVKAYDATKGVLLKTAAHDDDVETAAAGLTITANGDESSALVMLSEKADRGYAATEDAVMLAERERTASQVYTVGGHRALSINATSDAEGTEVGVMAGEDDMTVLRFDNVAGFEHLSLLDSATGEHMPLEEGLEYVVTGDVTGRLFLTSSVDTPEVELVGLDIMVENGDVVAKAPNASTGVDLYVYDPAGLCVASAKGCLKEARISGLERGIYLVVAAASDGTKCRKKLRL